MRLTDSWAVFSKIKSNLLTELHSIMNFILALLAEMNLLHHTYLECNFKRVSVFSFEGLDLNGGYARSRLNTATLIVPADHLDCTLAAVAFCLFFVVVVVVVIFLLLVVVVVSNSFC